MSARVLHVAKVAGISGSENHLLLLLPALRERGFDVRFVMLHEGEPGAAELAERLEAAGVDVARLDLPWSGDPRAFAARPRYRIDVNQESVAQGMANVSAGVLEGMPGSTSLSASSLNESAGARTPVASLTTGVITYPSFAPDGTWLAFIRNDDRAALWRVSVDGGEPTRLAVVNAVCPAVSPDGRWITFVLRGRGERNRIAGVGRWR